MLDLARWMSPYCILFEFGVYQYDTVSLSCGPTLR